MSKPITRYRFCNHHHKPTKQQKIVDLGTGRFVADKVALPLLKALNEVGLETRTHHVDDNQGFVGIMLDNVSVEIRKVFESHAARTKYNNRYCIILHWIRKKNERR